MNAQELAIIDYVSKAPSPVDADTIAKAIGTLRFKINPLLVSLSKSGALTEVTTAVGKPVLFASPTSSNDPVIKSVPAEVEPLLSLDADSSVEAKTSSKPSAVIAPVHAVSRSAGSSAQDEHPKIRIIRLLMTMPQDEKDLLKAFPGSQYIMDLLLSEGSVRADTMFSSKVYEITDLGRETYSNLLPDEAAKDSIEAGSPLVQESKPTIEPKPEVVKPADTILREVEQATPAATKKPGRPAAEKAPEAVAPVETPAAEPINPSQLNDALRAMLSDVVGSHLAGLPSDITQAQQNRVVILQMQDKLSKALSGLNEAIASIGEIAMTIEDLKTKI